MWLAELASAKKRLKLKGGRELDRKFTPEEKEKYIEKMARHLPTFRAAIGVNQKELAVLAGVARQTITSAETGTKKLTWTLFLALVYIFEHHEASGQLIKILIWDWTLNLQDEL
jgi:DNA-binding XRE family transcriptional regulator